MQEDPPDSPTTRVLRAIPTLPYIIDVPSERPYPNRPDQVAYEYARMAGATFRTRDDETNELHLQHISFLNRDVGGTLLTQHPLASHHAGEAVEPPTKRLKIKNEHGRATPTTPIKKKISLQDYKNKSAARSTPLAMPTPPPSSSHPIAPRTVPENSQERRVDLLKAILHSTALSLAARDMPFPLNWSLPMPGTSPASKPTRGEPRETSKPVVKAIQKPLAVRLQEGGKSLKKQYELLARTVESIEDVGEVERVKKRILALAVESVICFVRSFATRERKGESARKLWPTLYQMLDLVAHRAKEMPDVAGLLGMLDLAVAERAVLALGGVKWEDMGDDKTRREGWESVQKAVGRMIRGRNKSWERAVWGRYPKARDIAGKDGVMKLGDVESMSKLGLAFLEEWSDREGVQWRRTCGG